ARTRLALPARPGHPRLFLDAAPRHLGRLVVRYLSQRARRSLRSLQAGRAVAARAAPHSLPRFRRMASQLGGGGRAEEAAGVLADAARGRAPRARAADRSTSPRAPHLWRADRALRARES